MVNSVLHKIKLILFFAFCFYLFSCIFKEPEQKRYLNLNTENFNIEEYDEIRFLGISENSTDTVTIYEWKDGDIFPEKLYYPDQLSDNFTLLIIGSKEGKVLYAKNSKVTKDGPGNFDEVQELLAASDSVEDSLSGNTDYPSEKNSIRLVKGLKDTVVLKSESLQFEVEVDNNDVQYAWYHNNQLLEGVTTNGYLIDTVSSVMDSTQVLVIVYTQNDTIKSDAVIYVTDPKAPLKIVRGLADLQIYYGNDTTLNVTLNKEDSLSYKWFYGDSILSETDSLKITNVGFQDTGVYHVEVRQNSEQVTNTFKVSVVHGPPIISKIENILIVEGSSVEVRPVIAHTDFLTYAWRKGTEEISEDSVLQIDTAKLTNDGTYYLIIKNINQPELSDSSNQFQISVRKRGTFAIEIIVGEGGKIEPSGIGGIVKVDSTRDMEFTFEPDTGYLVEKLLIDGDSNSVADNNKKYTFSKVAANHKIEVTFKKQAFSLEMTVKDSLQGSVIISPDTNTHLFQDEVTVTAVPLDGWRFKSWSGFDLVLDTVNPLVFNMVANINATAEFDRIPLEVILLKDPDEGGAPELVKQEVFWGVPVQLKANPDNEKGYELDRWELVTSEGYKGVIKYVLSTDSTKTDPWIEVTEGNIAVKAFFKKKTFTISTIIDSGLGVMDPPESNVVVEIGLSRRVSFIPKEGYKIKEVKINGFPNVTAKENAYHDFINVQENFELNVAYEIIQFNLTFTSSPSEGGAVPASTIVNYGDTIDISATANYPYFFREWQTSSGTAFIENKNISSTKVVLKEGDVSLQSYFEKSDSLIIRGILDSIGLQDREVNAFVGNWEDGKALSFEINNLPISSIPSTIGELKYLKLLSLSSLNITSLPEEIGNLSSLTELFLGKNKLTKLPASLNNLKLLRKCDLSENSLSSFPYWLGEIDSLKSLLLDYNQIDTINILPGNFKSLISLFIGRNLIRVIPSTIGRLNSLEGLYVTNNQIVHIDNNIRLCKKLTSLMATNNQLESLPADIGELDSLKYLWVYDNQLKTLPSSIGFLKNLKEFFAHRNKLTSLPSSIGNLSNFCDFSVGFNELTSLPDSIVNFQTDYFLVNNNKLCLLSEEIKTWLTVRQADWQSTQTCE
ncbi:MAG: hypothetical protein HQK83_07415 [Fibrobacteria bacterium]|nr:hypothetical protein [Fibrobacteria bacterium]